MTYINPWTDEKIARLRLLWDTDLSTAAIGRDPLIRMTKSAVIGKAHRLDLTGRESPIIHDGRAPPHLRPQPVPRAPKPKSLPVEVAAVSKPRTCQFIKNDGRPWLFCDAPRWQESMAYCQRHHTLCYTKARAGDDGPDPAPWVRRDQMLKAVA